MVAYGETVAAAKENAVYTPPSEFIDYEGLKEEVYRAPSAEAASLLTHISGGSAAKRGERFISQLQVEMDKASRHVRARVSVIVGILANVLREAGKAEPASAELARLTQVTEDASAQIVELMEYVEICRTACRKAAKKFDKVQRTSLGSWLVAQLALQPFCNVSLEPLIVMLSDGFASLRAASNPPKTDAEGRPIEWVPPSDFERSTTKYWVKMESVPELTARVLKHLSILIMGRTPPTLAQMAAEEAPVLMHPEYAQAIYSKFYEGTSVLSWITSLYLDSLSFRQYHERLARDDGANLFRLRWYGLDPEQAGTVYVERKTHRSKDSGEKSTKQRLPIAPSAVRDLLHPERALDVAAQLDAQLAAGAISEKQRDKGVALGAEVQAALAERGLLPAVRTVYQRTAFQASDSNSVRLTLDSNLSLIKEALALGDAEAPAAVHEWCRNLSEPLDPAHILPFPFAVLEVKLQDETPAWVEELVASELLLPMAKFSKYLTGCAALHTGAVETLPYWFEEPAVKEALASQPLEGASYSLAAVRDWAPAAELDEAQRRQLPNLLKDVSGRSDGTFRTERTVASAAAPADRCSRQVSRQSSVCGGLDSEPDTEASLRSTPHSSRSMSRHNSFSRLECGLLGAGATSESRAHVAADGGHLDSAQRFGVAAKQAVPPESAPSETVTVPSGPRRTRSWSFDGSWSFALPSFSHLGSASAGGTQTAWSRMVDGDPTAGKRVARSPAARMEPKTFFANERTFTSWLSAGMLLLSVGIAITELEDVAGAEQDGGGLMIMCSALLLMLYGLLTFLLRLKKIKRKDPLGYDDPVGPVLLVIVLCGAVGTYLLRMYTFKWPGEEVHTADTPFSKEFEMGVMPSYFVNETAAIAMVARAMQASASVSSVTLAHATFELFRQTELDTAEDLVVNQGRSKVKLTTRLTLKGARYMSANLGSAPGTGSTDLTLSVKGTERAQLAATAANCVGRYAAHCEVKVEQNFHMEKAEVGQPRSPRVPLPATSWQRSVKISGMPHTTSLTTIGDLRGYFALPPRVPAGPFLLGTEDEERLYVRDEFYYWKVKLPFALAQAPSVYLYASLTTKYESPQLAVLPLQTPREDSELSFKIGGNQNHGVEVSDLNSDGALSLAAHDLYRELRSAPWVSDNA